MARNIELQLEERSSVVKSKKSRQPRASQSASRRESIFSRGRKGSQARASSLSNFFGGSRAASSASSGPTPVAAHVFSGRFLIGLVVLIFIAFAAYAPVSTYFQQQAEIRQVNQHIADLKAENSNLQTQLSWWKDDNYVKQQAKSRLYYVSEGETPYLVVGTDFKSHVADDTSAVAQTAPEQSWTNGLWNSFQQSALDGTEQSQDQPAAIPSATSSAASSPTP